ncbi:hypothetical protein [Sphaerisporangium aureirubrum]|uniref:Acetoacetate decarboxylase n=1 Tax=Sphaerisporangium aureirubrum TaxID=1544736 RepID=A0ABW1NTT2_9ACTN
MALTFQHTPEPSPSRRTHASRARRGGARQRRARALLHAGTTVAALCDLLTLMPAHAAPTGITPAQATGAALTGITPAYATGAALTGITPAHATGAAPAGITTAPAHRAGAAAVPWYLPWTGLLYHKLRDSADDRTWPDFAGIQASIEIPCVSGDGPVGPYHAWIGLGGFDTGNIIRAGLTGQAVRRGDAVVTTYTIWAESRRGVSGFAPRVQTNVPRPSFSRTGDDLCGRSVPVKVRSNGAVNLDGRWIRLRRPRDVSTAEYILQGRPRSSETVTFTDTLMTAFTRNLNVYGIEGQRAAELEYRGLGPVVTGPSSFRLTAP